MVLFITLHSHTYSALDYSNTHRHSVFVAPGHLYYKPVDLKQESPYPNCLSCVPLLVKGRQFKLRKTITGGCSLSVSFCLTVSSRHLEGTRTLELKWHAHKRQEMPVTGCCTESLGAWLAKIEAIDFLAVLLQGTWCELAVHAVVRAVAVATLLALPVCPESLIGVELAAMMLTTTIAAGHTKTVTQCEALSTLASLLARQRT